MIAPAKLLRRTTPLTVEHAIRLFAVWLVVRVVVRRGWSLRAFARHRHLLRLRYPPHTSHVRFHLDDRVLLLGGLLFSHVVGSRTSEFYFTFFSISSSFPNILACPAARVLTCSIPLECTMYAVISPIMIATSCRCMPVIISQLLLRKGHRRRQ